MPEIYEGLAKVGRILSDRSAAIQKLKAPGRKVVGYLCSYVPLEILTALDLLPFRILGDISEPITMVDRILPESFCPFMRSCIDSTLKNKYSFLDAVVGIHSCDPQEKICHAFKSTIKYEFFPYIDMPATTHEWGREMFRRSLDAFKKSCENYVGHEISKEALKASIERHNKQRALVRDLYSLKKADPPLISGSETLQVMMALGSIPLEEGNELLEEVIREVEARPETQGGSKKKRILVYGACLDAVPLIKLIEDFEADVVMDDNCMGPRTYFNDVSLTEDPMEGLTSRYMDLTCARTFREAVVGEFKKDRQADLEVRYGHLAGYIKEWDVQGVVIQLVRFCDPFGYELPELKDYLNGLNIPNMYLELEYTTGSLASLRTRTQTFLETLG